MKKFVRLFITSILAVSLLSTTAMADVISDSPFGASTEQSTTPPPAASVSDVNAITSSVSGEGAVIGDLPDSTGGTAAKTTPPKAEAVTPPKSETTTPPKSETTNAPMPLTTQSSGVGPGAGSSAVATAAPAAAVDNNGAPGSAYSNAARVRVDLGFTVVRPQHEYNGYKVAEGGAYLGNGSWESIGYSKYIRQPYFKLLREDGEWYVVSVHAKRIGNYSTSDGSTLSELWLKKSDCIAQNYIELNTDNPVRHQIVKNALGMLGKGYKYAGNGPDAYDCSGLVNKAMTASGVSMARSSYEICALGTQVGIAGLRPGDVVGRPGHVGIYIGDGFFVHAAESSTGVITDLLDVYNKGTPFTRYANVIGD